MSELSQADMKPFGRRSASGAPLGVCAGFLAARGLGRLLAGAGRLAGAARCRTAWSLGRSGRHLRGQFSSSTPASSESAATFRCSTKKPAGTPGWETTAMTLRRRISRGVRPAVCCVFFHLRHRVNFLSSRSASRASSRDGSRSYLLVSSAFAYRIVATRRLAAAVSVRSISIVSQLDLQVARSI